ncbi:hypothetical protein L4D09_26715 [Photobacterium makurazakiensis]|uniref:hypothetical protein n=1 Tax=Photobacterium makurazakiensis TaxID=2910234 RepID=UPI003D13CBFB
MASWFRLGSPTSQGSDTMRNENPINRERLEAIAKGLDGYWIYHQLLSDDRDQLGHYLYNATLNLYIRCNTAYRENIEQWSLCYRHPNGLRHIQSFDKIGSSLKKSDKAICSDLNARLIDANLAAVLQKMAGLKDEHEKNVAQKRNTDLELEAIAKVYDIEKCNHGRYDQNVTVNKKGDDDHRLARISKWHNQNAWSLEVGYIGIDKLFRVLAILNE